MQHYATECCDLQKSGPKQASCHEKHLNHYRRLYCHWMQNIHKNGRLPTLEILPDSSKPSSPGHACPSRLFEPSICARFGSRKQNQGSFSLKIFQSSHNATQLLPLKMWKLLCSTFIIMVPVYVGVGTIGACRMALFPCQKS